VAGLTRATEGPLWHQDAFAAAAPSGPPTTTLPLPTATAPEQLLLTWGADPAASVSFTDGLNGQTTYFHHVQLTGLRPGTRYHYQVSDGAATPSLAGASFETCPRSSSALTA
jgi:phosphodiesterase/alkaline phosphatase D-like protein